MKSEQIHPVVHEAHSVRGRRVELLDLVHALRRDGDHVAGTPKLKNPTFEPSYRVMVRIDSTSPHRGQIGLMRALPCPVDVLVKPAFVALDDVVSRSRDRALHSEGEAQEADDGGLPQNGKPPHPDPRHIVLLARREQIDLVTAPRELVEEPGGRRFDAAVKRERPTDDGEPHVALPPRVARRR